MGTILVGHDGSAHAQRALRWAAREAIVRSCGVTVGHVTSSPSRSRPASASLDGPLRQAGRRIVDDAIARLDLADLPKVDGEVIAAGERGVVAALVERSRDVDMVVVGSRGHGGLAGALLGSKVLQLAAHAHAPVVVIPGDERAAELDPAGDGRRDIAVGVDGSRHAARALAWACDEAGRRGAALEALIVRPALSTIYYDPAAGFDRAMRVRVEDEARRDAERDVAAALLACDACRDVDVTTTVLVGSAAPALVDAAGRRMLVVGSRGRGGFAALLLGSVGHRVLHHARGPIVVLPRGA